MSAAAKWFTLDTVGKLFPAIESMLRTETFRVSVTLHEQIDTTILQEALDYSIHRFPCFKVRLRNGFFWYYLEHNNNLPIVEADTEMPSRRIDRVKSNNYLFRVFYKDNRIAIDFFHAAIANRYSSADDASANATRSVLPDSPAQQSHPPWSAWMPLRPPPGRQL